MSIVKKLVLGAAVAYLAAGASAQARGLDVQLNIGTPAPVYVAPASVYVAPSPWIATYDPHHRRHDWEYWQHRRWEREHWEHDHHEHWHDHHH